MDATAVNYCSPREVGALLRERGIRPSKALGQNFLVDRNVLDRIVEAAGPLAGRHVVEVGAGLGVLTAALLAAGARVTAVEKDEALWPVLEERFGGRGGFSLVKGDALRLDWDALFARPDGPRRLVSNLPYYAASCAAPPESMTLLLQKEVGERFAAREGSAARGAASVWLQRLYDVRAVREVPPGCFLPRPEVTSVVLSLRLHGRHPLGSAAAAAFRGLVREAFLHRRKQLASAMRGAGGGFARDAAFVRAALRAVGASETARAEELSVERWLALAAAWGGGAGDQPFTSGS